MDLGAAAHAGALVAPVVAAMSKRGPKVAGRVECPRCHKLVIQRLSGRLWEHKAPDGIWCQGPGEAPVPR